MGDQLVTLAVASYGSRAVADTHFDALWKSQPATVGNHLSAALLEKGTSGELEINNHRNSVAGAGRDTALLGGALTTVAAPVGISYLASRLSSPAEWAGVAVIVGRFWHHIPRDKLRSMSNLLEAAQTGLVVVAIDFDREDVVACLSGAAGRVLSESMPVDLEADFTQATAEP